jgi:hypothetical protein
LKQRASRKKPLLEHYFTNFFKNLSNENLVALCGLLKIKTGKPKRKLYETPRRHTWVLQPHVNQQMIGSPPYPKEVWDS